MFNIVGKARAAQKREGLLSLRTDLLSFWGSPMSSFEVQILWASTTSAIVEEGLGNLDSGRLSS